MESTVNWLLALKHFLDAHPDIHFEMEVDPEGIDNDRNVYTLSLVRGNSIVKVQGPVFDDIEFNLGALFESARFTFGL